MIKTLLVFISLTNLSHAYTLNLQEHTTYENKKCSLEVGKKSYVAGRLKGEPNLMLQEAILITDNEKYEFLIEEREDKNNQLEFGKIPGEIFPTTVYLKKTKSNALSLQAIAENWDGRTDITVDCGVMFRNN